jgi:hypothetical protein
LTIFSKNAGDGYGTSWQFEFFHSLDRLMDIRKTSFGQASEAITLITRARYWKLAQRKAAAEEVLKERPRKRKV